MSTPTEEGKTNEKTNGEAETAPENGASQATPEGEAAASEGSETQEIGDAAEPQKTPPPKDARLRQLRWTVVVGQESQQIKMGGSPLFTQVAAVHVLAPDVEVAKVEARLQLVRALPNTESTHWIPVLVYLGHQEVVYGA